MKVYKDRQTDEWNRIESSQTESHIYGQLTTHIYRQRQLKLERINLNK